MFWCENANRWCSTFCCDRKECAFSEGEEYMRSRNDGSIQERLVMQLEEKILEIRELLQKCADEAYSVRLRVKMSAYEEIKEIIKSA